MQTAELEAWLRLGLIPRLGPVKFRKLLSEFGDPDSALGASDGMLAKVVGRELAAAIGAGPDSNLLASTLEWIFREENQLVTLADSAYPKSLLEISDPPPLLYIKGNTALLENEALAVLARLEYTKAEAKQMVQTALERNAQVKTVEELLNEVYRQQRLATEPV